MSNRISLIICLLVVISLALTSAACIRPASKNTEPWALDLSQPNAENDKNGNTPTPFRPESFAAGENLNTPTPNAPVELPSLRVNQETYIVRAGDSLLRIAQLYSVSIEQIVTFNDLVNPDYLEVGQVLQIPAPAPLDPGPDFKIIPNSELVDSPSAAGFDIDLFVEQSGGYLARHEEEVNGVEISGIEIVRKVSHNFSVNPRLLLAVLEYQSNWLSKNNPDEKDYPLGLPDPTRKGLYRQLSWAADNLNQGYYLWRVNALPAYVLADGALVPAASTINEGTAGIQYFFARLYGIENWTSAVSEQGLFTTFQSLFGYPFQYSIDPLLPDNLSQPQMQLPFERGDIWNFTGGPHGGWADGSAWAALDFAPPGEALGCVVSSAWVVATADGLITHTGDGQVILDLDGDGNHHTGWAVFYMHIESRDRIDPGTFVRAGDRIGHPSCEGGFSTGTHLHIARKYNGEWIPADQGDIPFVLDGWSSVGAGYVYDGWLVNENQSVIADNGRSEENEIAR